MRRFLAPLALALALAGCLPAQLQDAVPDAAVLGVPIDDRAPGAADELHARLEALPTGHDLVARPSLAFLEVRSGLVGGRAVSGAARVARNAGADVAVLVGAETLRRELEGPENAPLEEVVLRLETVLVRTADGEVLTRLSGPRLRAERFLAEDALPPLDEDELVRDLVDSSLDELAPRVARELEALALSGSSGG